MYVSSRKIEKSMEKLVLIFPKSFKRHAGFMNVEVIFIDFLS